MNQNKKFWNFKAKGPDIGELMLYGDISSSTWYGDEVTPTQFKKDLDALGDIKNLEIYINSGGGDVFAGQAIYSMLKRHKASKTVYIDGLAASIASVIAMVGDKIVMPNNAMMMIHRAWTFAAGNKDDFRKLADDMEKIDESIIWVYSEKTGIDAAGIGAMLDVETWINAEDAVKMGFADEIEQEKSIAASIDGGFLMLNSQKFDLARYKNAPEIIETPQISDNGDESQPAAYSDQENQFREIKKKLLEI